MAARGQWANEWKKTKKGIKADKWTREGHKRWQRGNRCVDEKRRQSITAGNIIVFIMINIIMPPLLTLLYRWRWRHSNRKRKDVWTASEKSSSVCLKTVGQNYLLVDVLITDLVPWSTTRRVDSDWEPNSCKVTTRSGQRFRVVT